MESSKYNKPNSIGKMIGGCWKNLEKLFFFLLTEMLYTCKTKSRMEMRDDLTIACYMK